MVGQRRGIGQVVGLPLLLGALLFPGRPRLSSRDAALGTSVAARRRRRVPRRRRLRRRAGFDGRDGRRGPRASATPTATATTATANPCATAPHDTFNISAINVDITLNKYGVHDPNSFMYVLNSNISAVRAEEASGQVSTGLGDDPIQPLVIRAHEGDCVTVNLTNATTFGVQAMDQPPAPDPADGCNNGTDPPLNAQASATAS